MTHSKIKIAIQVFIERGKQMAEDIVFIHKRNVLLFRLLASFYVINLVISVAVLGYSVLYPPVGMVLIMIVGLTLSKQKIVRFMMWALVFLIFAYFFYLITDHPYLINYIFMWTGLVVSAIYQNYKIILFAGSLSLVLTMYTFFRFENEVFTGADHVDIYYLLLFGVFLTVFLLFLTKYINKLVLETKQGKEKLNFILDSSNIVTFSYSLQTEELLVTTGEKVFPHFPTKLRTKSPIIWKHFIHSEDLVSLVEREDEILNGISQSAEFRLVLPMKENVWVRCQFIPIFDGATVKRIDGILIDISMQKSKEEEYSYLAYHDPLTGLPNRSKLEVDFARLISKGSSDKQMYLVFIDLDGFKTVNDRFGHAVGDLLLKNVAVRLKNYLSKEQIIARLSGDEFVLVLSDVSKSEVEEIAAKMKNYVSVPYSVAGHQVSITISIGIYQYSHEKDDLHEMIRRADLAMYRVKENGKNDIFFYKPLELEV